MCVCVCVCVCVSLSTFLCFFGVSVGVCENLSVLVCFCVSLNDFACVYVCLFVFDSVLCVCVRSCVCV